MDPHLEASQQALAVASGREAGLGVLEVGEHGETPGFGITARFAGVAVDHS